MIYVNIRGGLGNQLFQYASARSYAIEQNEELCLDLNGITNQGHNVLALDRFCIQATSIQNCSILQKKISRIFASVSYRLGQRFGYDFSYKFDVFWSPLLNLFGIYNIENGYMKFKNSITKNKYINGYLQSDKYMKHADQIKEELCLKDGLSDANQAISTQMKAENSVCIHIRRGDFVEVGGIVCTEQYYVEAARYLATELEQPQFYIFSNDIAWVKENIHFPMHVNYIEGNNPSYEEVSLMASCKHFIISNSTFSWWGQFLSQNHNKIVIAPDRWFVDGQKEDIYQDNWKIMDSNGKMVR